MERITSFTQVWDQSRDAEVVGEPPFRSPEAPTIVLSGVALHVLASAILFWRPDLVGFTGDVRELFARSIGSGIRALQEWALRLDVMRLGGRRAMASRLYLEASDYERMH